MTQRIQLARLAALADPQGHALAVTLDLPKPEPQIKPIRFFPRKTVT